MSIAYGLLAIGFDPGPRIILNHRTHRTPRRRRHLRPCKGKPWWAGGIGHTCDVILVDAGLCLRFPKEFKNLLITWFHECLRCFPVFIPYPVPKSQVVVTAIEGRGNEMDERIIGARIQQAPDKIYSGFWILCYHGEV